MLPNAILGPIHMYGVMIAIGVLCAFGVIFYYGKKRSMDAKFLDFVFYNGIISVMVGFAFASLFQALYDYIEDPSAGFQFGEKMTFIGGLVGGTVCFLVGYLLFRKKYRNNLYDVLHIAPCAILIAHAFGRIGCFFAGCCYGKETSCIFGVQFPGLDEPVHPTQLYEAAFLFVLFGIMSWLLLKKKFQYSMSLYLIAYGCFRFTLEFLRGDDRGKLLGLISPSQFWSLAMIVIGVALICVVKRHMRVQGEE